MARVIGSVALVTSISAPDATSRPADRPPSVDTLARSMAPSGLPHPLLVDLARRLIAERRWHDAEAEAHQLTRTLLQPVINATGVLLHTNLGRAPVAHTQAARAANLELDLATGQRGSRQSHVGALFAQLCGAEAAMVVNNNAAAVLLVVGALAHGREVLVARGEAVEIGGGFRVPEVMEQSGAILRDVGTTNRTRLADYAKACNERTALTLKVHPSNYRVEGFIEETTSAELATLPVPVVADIGSGLLDATCPWLPGGPPSFLAGEPAARQTIEEGASLITFSTDKLLGGPQGGVIAGRADLVALCARHPLARAVRPGGLVLAALQDSALAYLRRDAATTIPFWKMVAATVEQLEARGRSIVEAVGFGSVAEMLALPGAGSLPGITIESRGIVLDGDHLDALRNQRLPIIARVREQRTFLDLRSVDPGDDELLIAGLRAL
jgi:L-seryl-tRNA(Ser) seleniumtransferase